MNTQVDILFEVKSRAGVITLNKPASLNAVTDDMLTALRQHLDLWEKDEAISRVIIKAAPGRAFSAGGDIRHLYDCGIAKDYDFDFFAREYALNVRIARFPKPYIALVDGIAMGGGVGVSFHGSHRVAGEGLSFAMPEVGIGFFPDVGASYFLSRLPGALGLYLGLTGQRMKQSDAVWSGLATHGVLSGHLEALEDALCVDEDINAALSHFAYSPEPGPLQKDLPLIARFFDHPTLQDVQKTLQAAATDATDPAHQWAGATMATMRQKSPTSLAIAFQQIRSGAALSIEECMKMEFRILTRILPEKDFYEGIRAAIIDKDNSPVWQTPETDASGNVSVDRYFEPLDQKELVLP